MRKPTGSFGKSMGSGGSINTTSIKVGDSSYKSQGKPTPQAGASVAAPIIRCPESRPTVSKQSAR